MAEDLGPMNGENRSLVTNKMIEVQEFEKKSIILEEYIEFSSIY
jgi:hypothetical protein